MNYELPEIGIEPGRSIVGEAGITLYEVGTIKRIPEVNKYVSVDGGMSDHIRTGYMMLNIKRYWLIDMKSG